MKHNHVTRDVKPLGECPACDFYSGDKNAQLNALSVTYDFNYCRRYSGKAVIVRKEQRCFSGMRSISKGSPAYRTTILPSSTAGQMWDLDKPSHQYFCGYCGDCTAGTVG